MSYPQQILSFLDGHSGAIIAIFTVILVGVTWYYARLTKQIVKKTDDSLKQNEEIIKQNTISHEQTERIIKQNRTEKKIAFLAKRLEKLYYPLQDYLNSEEMVEYCSYWEVTSNPPNDEPSIDELKNPNTNRYGTDEILPYLYLASDNLRIPLDGIFEIRGRNAYNWDADSPDFKQKVDDIKKIVKDDIDSFRDELNDLIK